MSLPAGIGALGLVLGVVTLGLVGLFAAAAPDSAALPWHYVGSVVRFTLLQAALSTLLSVTLGTALALALARRQSFRGRSLFIAALNLASVLPAIVAVFAIVAVLGRAGWAGQAARLAGFDAGAWLYGLPGILIAHVFFNAPLAARIVLASLSAVPGEHWRLAEQLGMRAGAVFRFIDWPVLRRELPAVAALVFLLCFTSFAVVLALGGGPGTATLEVAIFEAVRFDVDFNRAGILALLQVCISLGVTLPIVLAARRTGESAALGLQAGRPDADVPVMRVLDAGSLTLGALLVLPPLAAIAIAGGAGWRSLIRFDVVIATATSIAIAVPAALIALTLALALASGAQALRARGSSRIGDILVMGGALILSVPPVALSAGLFVAMRRIGDPLAMAVPLIILVNALMALPFVLRQVEPPLALSAERYGRLAGSLGLRGFARLRLADWPLLRRPLLAALAISIALSLGDLGVAAFFGTGRIVTLPLLLYERMGSYRSQEAASVAALLSVLVLCLFAAAQKWSGDVLARSR